VALICRKAIIHTYNIVSIRIQLLVGIQFTS
jgi:hypothetical protein